MNLPSDDLSELDWEQALTHVGGSLALVAELVEVARVTWPELLARLREGVAAADAEAVMRAAHSLRSSTALLGGLRAARLAGELERDARRGESASCASRADELVRLVTRLEAALAAHLRAESQQGVE